MILAKLNPDGSIDDVIELDDKFPVPVDHVVLTPEQLSEIATSKYGHMAFDYAGGNLVHKKQREEAEELRNMKRQALIEMGTKHAITLAKAAQPSKANAISSASSVAALRAAIDL